VEILRLYHPANQKIMKGMTMSRFTKTKEKTYKGYQLYEGAKAEEGFSTEILDSLLQIVTFTLQRHSQVLMVCLQFNFPAVLNVDGIDNSCFQSFIEAYRRCLANKGMDPEYLWVRETGTINDRCHYHLLLLLDGNTIRYFGDPFEVRKYWLNALKNHFNYDSEVAPLHVQTLPQMQHGIMIKRSDPSAISMAIEIGSYLAKIATKTSIGKYIKTFSTSQCFRRCNNVG